MKGFFRMKAVTAAFALGLLFFLSVQTLISFFPEAKKTLAKNESAKFSNIIQEVNLLLDESFYQRYRFINVYGLLQKLLGKNEENNFEVISDERGFLHYTFFADGPQLDPDLPERAIRLRSALKDNTELICLMPPDKYLRGYTKFPRGIPYPYFNENADLYLQAIEKEGIPFLDFRERILESKIPKNELFFKTDHHWTIQTSFWAFRELVNYFHDQFNIDLDPDRHYTDIANYNQIKYENFYLGSMGRKTGTFYAGADDFTLIFPKFITNYTCFYDIGSNQFELTGPFEETQLYSYALNTVSDNFSSSSDKYGVYLHGNPSIVHIRNNDKPDGLKVLFIKDSMSVPLASFFSSVCSEVWLIDPRYYQGDIETFARETAPDFVLVSIYPQALVDEFFPYCKEEK